MKDSSRLASGIIGKGYGLTWNKSLKQTVTRVTPFAAKAKPAPRYGGLVPPFYRQLGPINRDQAKKES